MSGLALNYNEGRKKSPVMASLEYIIIALECGAETERERGGREGEN